MCDAMRVGQTLSGKAVWWTLGEVSWEPGLVKLPSGLLGGHLGAPMLADCGSPAWWTVSETTFTPEMEG